MNENDHHLMNENPNTVSDTDFQYKYAINVVVGIVGDFLVKQYYLPSRITGKYKVYICIYIYFYQMYY